MKIVKAVKWECEVGDAEVFSGSHSTGNKVGKISIHNKTQFQLFKQLYYKRLLFAACVKGTNC